MEAIYPLKQIINNSKRPDHQIGAFKPSKCNLKYNLEAWKETTYKWALKNTLKALSIIVND